MRARSLLGGTGAIALVAGLLVGMPTSAQAVSASAPVIINEVYGGGGNVGATLQHDFIELYNASSATVNLTGWTVQYTSTAGTAWTNSTALTGRIPAGATYVVREAQGTGGTTSVTGDVSGNIAMSGTAGKVALVNSTAALTCGADCDSAPNVVDFVGYGTGTNDFAGTGPTPPFGNNANSVSRNATHTNTANNAADFTAGAATPAACGAACVGSDPEPDPDPINATIAEIQGTGAESPLKDKKVITKGIVTATYPAGGFRGYYIQTPGTGGAIDLTAPPTASNGVFIFQAAGDLPAAATEIGNYIQVTGTAVEFFGLTEINVAAADVVDLAETAAPVVTTTTSIWPRTAAQRESLEGVLYRPADNYTITNTFTTNQFGEVGLAFGNTPLIQRTEVEPPGPASGSATEADNLARQVNLDDGSSTNFLATVSGRLTNGHLTPPYVSLTEPVIVGAGVSFTKDVIVDFRNNVWKFQPTTTVIGPDNANSPADFENTRTAAPDETLIGDADLKVASFNVLNYFTTLGTDDSSCTAFLDRDGNGSTVNGGCDQRGAWDSADFAKQQVKIVEAINALDADVIGLMEIENSTSLGEVQDEALNSLVAALNADAGAGTWAANPSSTDLPASGMDVITNAIIYKPAEVTRVGGSRALGNLSDDGQAFGNAREPIAQAFAPVGGGDPFLFVVNHFKSKGSAGPWPGDADQNDGQGASNVSRVMQAEALRDWVPTVLAGSGVESVALAGDFNSYTEEDPLQVLYDAGYEDVERHFENGEYSYSFSGLSGSLDHILVNEHALDRSTGTDIWNINSGESLALEYSRWNYHATDFHQPTAYRSSDHDPVVLGLKAGAENSATTLSVSGTSQTYGTFDPESATATVELSRGGQPAGSVTFSSNGSPIGTAPVANGKAVFELPSNLPAGAHSLTATFVPADTDAASGSTSAPPVAFTVEKAESTTGLTATAAKAKVKKGPAAYLVDMVAPVSLETGRAAVGTVVFTIDGVEVARATVFNGSARAVANAEKGSRAVQATFVPADPANHVGSSSPVVTVDVK